MSLPDYMGPSYKLVLKPPPEEPRGWRRIRLQLRDSWPRPRLWAAAFAALVAGLGLHGLAFSWRLPRRLPTDLDWRAAGSLVARDALPGDAVALAPAWAERGREIFPERLPARPEVALPVLSYPAYSPGAEDLVGVRRVWLVELLGAPGGPGRIPADLAARSSSRYGPLRLGAIEVTRYQLRSPVLPLAFLPDRLPTATVRLGDRPCQRDPGGVFRCPAPPWVRVSREVREVAGLPRSCLWAHPHSDPGAPLTIEFPGVPLGRVLRGHTGIVGAAALDGSTPVRLLVRVDGEELGAAVEPPRRPGWHAYQLDTTRYAGSQRTIAFTVTAADPARRHFCFDAMTLP